MRRSRRPPPVAPAPPPPPSEELPEPREPSVRQLPSEAELPQEQYPQEPEQEQQHAPHEHEAYDEHGQPYPQDEQAYAEQHYDEHGQPYYDEHGQPYYDEHGQPYDHHAYPQDYATAPMAPPQAMQMHMQPMPAPPPSHPYRIPTAPVEPPVPVFQGAPLPKPPRPIIGSAIAVYGVLLWSFVVAGQFATSWITGAPMSQGTAAFLVFVSTAAAWGFALERSRTALPSATMGRFFWRGVVIAALAALMFSFTIIIATIFGQSTHGHDFLIAFLLVAASVAAIIMGPRLTLPKRPERTHRMRFAVISMWVIGVILTFVAGAELATNG